MELLTLPLGLPDAADISSRDIPAARSSRSFLVASGIVSRRRSTRASASALSSLAEAPALSGKVSKMGQVVWLRAFRRAEMQAFFVHLTAQASALRISRPSLRDIQSLRSTSWTMSSGSPGIRDAQKKRSVIARTFGLIAVSSFSNFVSILHKYRRRKRQKLMKRVL